MLNLRCLTPGDWRIFREVRLAALAEAPYAYSSTLAEWQGENDSERRWRKRLTDVPFNVVAHLDGVAAGLAGGTAPNDDCAIYLISMWVAPFARGRGVADALIRSVLDYAVRTGVKSVCLLVREANAAARAAYERNGFVDAGPAMEKDGPPERRMVFSFGG